MSENSNMVTINEQQVSNIIRTCKKRMLKAKLLLELNFDGLGGDPTGCASVALIKGDELIRLLTEKNMTYSHGRIRESYPVVKPKGVE